MPIPARQSGLLDRPVTAALRAGYAWSTRHERPEAWREVARMTGVIMRSFGPGRGPVTPSELLPLLHRPLGDWLPGAAEDEVLADMVILDDRDELTDATFEIGCDYTVELLAGQVDPGERWLPSWRMHRAEQVENATFETLISGSDREYSAGRRFLIDYPAGDQKRLLGLRNDLGLPPLAEFTAIPHERQFRGWWWPCPECRWPMRVRAGRVNCCFPHHRASYILLDSGKGTPRLQPMDGARRAGLAQAVEGAVCVDESIWRYIVVPGVVEVRLYDRIVGLQGVTASLYPGKDLYDIQAEPADTPAGQPPKWDFTIDLKDHSSARTLADKIITNPVAARYVVLPNYRKSQLKELGRLLPSITMMTEDRVYNRIKQTLARHRDAQ
ncbi:hypothetical protein [Actinoallomurus sp. NPDC052274]|uniref:pPIWI_RE_Y domain-containing protein n=1 Tax=Actinoallomurus sp. NPDC052274 TaxID=3155420 RepID=UPI003440F05A